MYRTNLIEEFIFLHTYLLIGNTIRSADNFSYERLPAVVWEKSPRKFQAWKR